MKSQQAVDGQAYSHLEMLILKVGRQAAKKKQEVESNSQPHPEHGIKGEADSQMPILKTGW